MANPRQRRKTRSGTHRAVRHSNHAKKMLKKQPPIRGPKVLQDAWDKHRTVRQNYEALGLLTTLNPTASGGVESRAGHSADPEHSIDSPIAPEASGSQKEAGRSTSHIPKGYGRIVRDENGNVVDVEMGEEDTDEQEPAGSTFEEDVNISTQEALVPWVALGSRPNSGSIGTSDKHVVQSLEEISKAGDPVPRFTSTGESKLLRNLIATYGQDVDAMARDRKLNISQRTAGELHRAIKKAGGFLELSKGG